MINKKIYRSAIIIISFLLSFCAQISAPTGGPQDEEAPKILKSRPLNRDTGFTDKILYIKFDEYVQLNEINTKFFSSPPFLTLPDFRLKGKSLIIKLKEPLKDSTTYTLYFYNSIKDYNEGNQLEDLQLVFSTHAIVDSFEIAGYVYDAFKMEKYKDVFVMLYKNISDSVPYLQTPYFVARTDSAGYFNIKNIKPGNYKLFGLIDMNNNLLYDLPNENICFLDTNINADLKIKEFTDTIKIYDYVYDETKENIIDSTQRDSTSLRRVVEYLPNNLKLFVFSENRQKQFVNATQRNRREMCALKFNRELDSNFIIKPINFAADKYLLQKFKNKDSIVLWITDSNFIKNDTLKFEILFSQLDSLDNFFIDNDTVECIAKKLDKDTIYTKISTNLKTTYDLFKPIEIFTQVPINKIDTAKIEIFMLQDTVVETDLTQKIILSERQLPNLLLFTFARPLVKTPVINFYDFPEADSTDYKIIFNKTKDSITINISNQEIYNTKNLKFFLTYDNNYFFAQYQIFKIFYNLEILPQKIVSKKRDTNNKLQIVFAKNINADIRLNLLNDVKTPDWYDLKINNNVLNIDITDKNIANIDTLIIDFKASDYTDFEDKNISFTDTTSFVFKREKQKIISIYKTKKNNFYLLFNNNLETSPKITAINYGILNWYSTDFTKDTRIIEYTILSSEINKMKDFTFVAEYQDILPNDSILLLKDTFILANIKTQETKKTENNVKIKIKQDYLLTKDTAEFNKFYLAFNQKADKKYLLNIDSMAFTDNFNRYNDTLKYEFTINTKDSYGSLSLNLKNIGAMYYNTQQYDELNTDTTDIIIDKLPEGQAIIQIWDSKESNMLYEFFETADKTIKIDNIEPQNLIIKIIYDKNLNLKWDTGNYLFKQLPEKVFYYKTAVTVKSKFINEIDWTIETY